MRRQRGGGGTKVAHQTAPRVPRSEPTITISPVRPTAMKLRLIARCAVMSALHRDELAHDALDKTVRGAEPKRDTLGLKPAREVGMREGEDRKSTRLNSSH